MPQRFINLVIDAIAGVGALAFVLAFFSAAVGLPDLIDNVPNFALMFVYYVLTEGVFGRTLGKVVTGTRVVTARGQKVPWKTSLLRTLIRFVPFEAFSFLGDDRGWHDRWTGTRVVKTRRPKNWAPEHAVPL